MNQLLQMDWPTNLFLTPANIKMYNDIFRFILKIKCALFKLQRLCLDGNKILQLFSLTLNK